MNHSNCGLIDIAKITPVTLLLWDGFGEEKEENLLPNNLTMRPGLSDLPKIDGGMPYLQKEIQKSRDTMNQDWAVFLLFFKPASEEVSKPLFDFKKKKKKSPQFSLQPKKKEHASARLKIWEPPISRPYAAYIS